MLSRGVFHQRRFWAVLTHIPNSLKLWQGQMCFLDQEIKFYHTFLSPKARLWPTLITLLLNTSILLPCISRPISCKTFAFPLWTTYDTAVPPHPPHLPQPGIQPLLKMLLPLCYFSSPFCFSLSGVVLGSRDAQPNCCGRAASRAAL